MRIIKSLVAAQLLLLPSCAFSQRDSPSVSLTIRAESALVESGNVIAIDIEIKNGSNRAINCERNPVSGDLDMAFQYEIRTTNGSTVPRDPPPHPEIGYETHGWPCLLHPGETAQSVAIISRRYDLKLPGRYSIRISQVDTATGQVVKSNQIEVTVDPPKMHLNEKQLPSPGVQAGMADNAPIVPLTTSISVATSVSKTWAWRVSRSSFRAESRNSKLGEASLERSHRQDSPPLQRMHRTEGVFGGAMFGKEVASSKEGC
jgi:hypothetical protein